MATLSLLMSLSTRSQPWRHFIDREWLAKLDELASCALIQVKILAFNRFIRCSKTIADRYLLRRQATVVQQSTAQSAMENRHPSACFRPRFSPPRLPDRLSSPNVAKEAVPDTESCGHQCLCRSASSLPAPPGTDTSAGHHLSPRVLHLANPVGDAPTVTNEREPISQRVHNQK
jgi:hypothetical protein